MSSMIDIAIVDYDLLSSMYSKSSTAATMMIDRLPIMDILFL